MGNLLSYVSIVIFLLIGNKNSFSQNLVPNNSFELFSTCPTSAGEVANCLNWTDPTGTSSDYYHSCGTGGANVPYCGNGFQQARTLNAYMGLWALNGYGSNFREYIQVDLGAPLVSDSCYKIEFYCNLHNYSGYSVNKLGLILTDSALTTSTNGDVLEYVPIIESDYFLSDTVNWMKISGYYTAIGGEKYATIGNFRTDSSIDTLPVIGNSYPGAYYLIEDVLIEKIDNCDTLSILTYENEIIFSVYPNPNQGIFVLSNQNSEAGKFILFDLLGQEVYSCQVEANKQTQLNLEYSNSGIYLFEFVNENGDKKSGKLVITRP